MSALQTSRRRLLAACGSLATVAGVGASSGRGDTPPLEGAWTLNRGNAANSGVADQAGPRAGPRVRWRFEEHLVSRKPPVIADNRLYVGTFEESASFVALNAATGEEVWRTDLGDGHDVRFPASAAAIAESTVVAPFGNLLIGFDAETGAERWRTSFDDGQIHAPVAVDGVAYVTSRSTGELHALETNTGTTRWQAPIGGLSSGSPAVVDGVVYAAVAQEGSGSVVALDTATGDELWRQSFTNAFATPPAVSDGAVYLGDTAGLVALDANDGSERWRFATGSRRDSERHNWTYTSSAPAVADGTVYSGAPDNRVYAVDAESGTKRWEFWTWHNATGDPVVAGDTVYVGSDDSFVYAFDVETGERRWEFDTHGTADGAGGAVVDGVLFVSMWQDGLYALEEA